MSLAWSLLAWGGLLCALQRVWHDQRAVAAGPERLVYWSLAALGFAATWTFMITMARQDIARYASLVEWSAGSNLFFEAYRRVTDTPAAWWWTQQLMLWAPAAILFFHAESVPRRQVYWPYIWVGLCVAVSAALPLFLLRHRGGGARASARVWTGLCLGVAALATAALPFLQGDRFLWCIVAVHAGVLLSLLPVAAHRSSTTLLRGLYLLFAAIAAWSWWATNLQRPTGLWAVVWNDPAQSSISLDLVLTLAVCLFWVARRHGARAAAWFALAAGLGSLGAAFCLYRLQCLRRTA
jgi:hypothetical protein